MLEIVVRYSELPNFSSRSYWISDHKRSFVLLPFVRCI